MTLQEFFHGNPHTALGFSGGVDSAYLLYAALQWGAEVRPYYIKTSFQPEFELEDAMRLGRQFNVKITVLEYDILTLSAIAANPSNRCYYCKKALFGLLQKRAVQDGYSVLIDGTNASDKEKERPGMQALQELSVKSPLRQCGLTKTEIRRLSKEAGLFTWNKPAYACLATRIPVGQSITVDLLKRVEGAENVLFSLGFSDFRVRVLENMARLQLKSEQIQQGIEKREEIIQRIKPYFETILLDMETRE